MRGEYRTRRLPRLRRRELPPRARRIPSPIKSPMRAQGTTSACAENTSSKPAHQGKRWNYLRVRGEYRVFFGDARPHQELPPRARRIRVHVGPGVAPVGTTSACAENTSRISSQLRAVRNYLRVRGEYFLMKFQVGLITELPPRARRIPPWRRSWLRRTELPPRARRIPGGFPPK